ncbi:ATP-binding cassette subfamily B protein [Clostridium tetanomorphum]|uniref:ABC transporter ATP-binding protein n=1 Tax=Clostridium tetanomorphum TaxID=1553 RepID=A0A923E6R9_CLOTT|nr:ABC transporter ATP-binding protein [Clostridium tetanomorphum]KAJ50272.1 ABC transporter ATP-binding protein/permease [Clostridium tetanomorphum DSM 665]MBC2396171.1 ABC transporter ATP-binding protein [Clostridium tetanomorphum]MBP1864413.1 ATP-binding cassette subfamily B protein [Clostridium tetanomorphum]NRS83859.1 ATP-binding cassette subfamily B protein [Clostridium tetanomorphum]NRZ97046.1 ATP-binding cassette subfamily B protein [Clostridium tetanomorphum]
MKKQSNLGFLLEISGKEKLKLYLSAIFSVISSLLSIVPYILMYNIVLELFKNTVDYERIKSMAITVGIIVVIRMAVFLLSGVFSHIAAFTILYELRMKAINHMSRLNMGFFTGHTLGEVKKTINEDIEKLENFIAHQIPDLSAAAVTPIIIIGYLLYLDWRLALVLFIPIILGIISQIGMFKAMKERMEHYHYLLQKINSTIIQYINGMNVMKAFNLSAKSFKNYKDITKEYADYWVQMTKESSPAYAVFLVLIDSGLLFMIPIGGIMFLKGSINVSTYLLFLILSSNFLTSFKQLLEFGVSFSMLLEGAGKVRDILDQPIQVEGIRDLNEKINGKIQFNNVTFKYDKEEVIKNLSLTIEPKTVVALVGPSGSGKTTLGQLVGRFWDVDKGSIAIDGIDLKDIKMEELMDKVSFVFQDVFMLQDTILENIKMGSDKTMDQIIEASKKAQIHDFIMSLPDGYNTSLGENGIKLSGGEKQRISIARAILKNSPIVILDEVTSYSDIENESKIQEALRNLLKGKTAIIIAHRLYTIKNADKIIVLDEGKIIEQGKHKYLMNKKGLYRHLWDMYDYELAKAAGGE